MIPKNTICLWYDKDAEAAAQFYAATFPDSAVRAVHRAPSDFPGGKQGDVLTVEFTVLGIPCLGLNGGPHFKHSEAFSFQVATDDQEETDRYWDAIVGNGGQESACGSCKDRWGLSWQITPRTLMVALAGGGAEARRAFEAMMTMRKIDVATIAAARRGSGQLHAAILRSARVHARLVRIDATRSRALPGVHAVITAADVPDLRPIGVAKDHLPLKRDRVRSTRDEIAAVAAESEAIAEAALKLIKVEYEDLPVLADPNESLKPGAPLIHPEPHGASAKHDHLKQAQGIAYLGKPDNIAMVFDYAQGDVAAGERESDVVFEDTFHQHYVTHCCMGNSRPPPAK